MSVLDTRKRARLFFSVFSADGHAVDESIAVLSSRYGPVIAETPFVPFNFTDYYAAEFGAGLVRKIAVMAGTVDPALMPGIKTSAVEIEQSGAIGGKRRVNIDPGYMEPSRVVLVTGKDYAHRIWLGEGVYADLTLMYSRKNRGYEVLPWTYPDYATGELRAYFNAWRTALMSELKGRDG